ncbi:hypothetical protein [Nocardia panacis]|uniref:hypothetical protein n=1 Tax=Nocardia panacis TaxID=2340916 RepID=UPI001EEFDAD5|nr:hypothetical protein [Nocardia panacis]
MPQLPGTRVHSGHGWTIDYGLIDHRGEPCPHHIVGPGKGCIQGSLIYRTRVDTRTACLPLRYQAFVHTEVCGELPDAHALGIAKGTGLSS